MGWANCGTDDNGRPIGYGHSATCDHPGCTTKIDRGLGYACGSMHGFEDLVGNPTCEKYFCAAHLFFASDEVYQGTYCAKCIKTIDGEGDEDE